MVRINGVEVDSLPRSCGSCPFFKNGSTHLSPGSERGLCILFEEMHFRWINTPRRCVKIFRKALNLPTEVDWVIVYNDNKE